MRREIPFNPLDKKNLGVSVADALLAQPPVPLPLTDVFLAAGIYAIYYSGSYSAYRDIADANQAYLCSKPIYVGKAVPAGARKGGFSLDVDTGPVLYNRLNEHAQSLSQASNLDLADFQCRYLAVDDIWIPLGESLLIQMFSPIWNKVIDGFGNHDPGSGRRRQQRSAWDVLHPGRPWAVVLAENVRSEEQILAKLAAFLARSPLEAAAEPVVED